MSLNSKTGLYHENASTSIKWIDRDNDYSIDDECPVLTRDGNVYVLSPCEKSEVITGWSLLEMSQVTNDYVVIVDNICGEISFKPIMDFYNDDSIIISSVYIGDYNTVLESLLCWRIYFKTDRWEKFERSVPDKLFDNDYDYGIIISNNKLWFYGVDYYEPKQGNNCLYSCDLLGLDEDWATSSPMPVDLRKYESIDCCSFGTKIVIIGFVSDNHNKDNELFVYDSETNIWDPYISKLPVRTLMPGNLRVIIYKNCGVFISYKSSYDNSDRYKYDCFLYNMKNHYWRKVEIDVPDGMKGSILAIV